MSNRVVRCQVVEVPADQTFGVRQPPRDLLPWADPYIARLLVHHRLECAMVEREEALEQIAPDVLPINRFRNATSSW
jgi:hypothetical protein